MESSKSSSKAVATVAANTLAVATEEMQGWGNEVALGTQDIILAKILPMQGLSVLVADGKAMMGEFRDSLSGAKLGSIAEPIVIIPFHVEKVWDILEEQGDQFKWVKSEPLIEDPIKPGYNDNLPWSDTVDGIAVKRVRRMNFYVMLPSQIATGDSVPYVLSFKSTSYREGKKLFTQMYMRNRRANLAPAAYNFVLGGVKTKNDKGTFIVPTVELGLRVSAAELEECFNWYKLVKKGGVKVDESEEVVSEAEIMPEAAATMGSEGKY